MSGVRAAAKSPRVGGALWPIARCMASVPALACTPARRSAATADCKSIAPHLCRPIDIGGRNMRTLLTIAILLGLAAPATAQTADRLYVMDCGHNSAKDQSRWSPGVSGFAISSE